MRAFIVRHPVLFVLTSMVAALIVEGVGGFALVLVAVFALLLALHDSKNGRH